MCFQVIFNFPATCDNFEKQISFSQHSESVIATEETPQVAVAETMEQKQESPDAHSAAEVATNTTEGR